MGRHKTSVLQEVEAGRAIEMEALAGPLVGLGRLTELPTPSTTAIYRASKLSAHSIDTETIAVRGITLPQG